MRKALGTLGVVCGLLAASPVLAQHFTDIWVGQTQDGQLSLGGISLDVPIALEPVDGVVTGWSNANPGFDNVQGGEALQPLAEGSEIWLDLVSLSPGCGMIDNAQRIHTHEDIQVSNTGVDSVPLGGEHLHTHFTWLIDSNSPRFDPLQTLWTVDLRLRDESGSQETSDTFRIMFRNVECTLPGDIDADGRVTDVDLDRFYSILETPADATHEARCMADLSLDGFVSKDDEAILLAEVGLNETPMRGDANADAVVEMSDAVVVLNHLYLGSTEPLSMVHANANGDAIVDVADPVYLLSYLFLGGAQPPAPFGK